MYIVLQPFFKKKFQLVWLCKHLQPIIINNAKHKKIKFVGLCQCKPENSVDLIKIEGKKKTKFTLKMLCKMNTKLVNNNNKMLHYRIIAISWQ